MKEITTQELKELRKKDPTISVIDVREVEEVAEGMIPDSTHIPMGEIPNRLNEIDKERTHYLVCRSGGRSRQVGHYMEEQGYHAINVDGGIIAWDEETEKPD